MNKAIGPFIRYPGGKRRMLDHILPFLPNQKAISGKYVEPFVGGGAVFFALGPQRALLSDINKKLIELYHGLRLYPVQVWLAFKKFPSDKEGYYRIRDSLENGDLAIRAAKTLYLNRTCFKGMWRENACGGFNVGYGGEERRWVINLENLVAVSDTLRHVELLCSDFQEVLESCDEEDFVFLDPPYRPGQKELRNSHYAYSSFQYSDNVRLAKTLDRATKKGILWAMTISAHREIVAMFRKSRIIPLPKGTGKRPGIPAKKISEVLICNY